MLGITIRSSEAAQPFWRLVARASAYETEPSIRKLGYPPHLTLARYDKIDAGRLTAALDVFSDASAFTLVFDRIRTFETKPLILWLAPKRDARLLELHGRLHASIGVQRSDPHYRPRAWQPHCTIATMVAPELRRDAEAFAEQLIEPFTITFDVAESVEWPPVKRLGMRRLG